MAFIQIIDFHTDRIDDGTKYVEEYEATTEGRRRVGKTILTSDRDQPGHYLALAFFDSYEEAMKNSEMPETQKLAANLAALTTSGPTFLNLDVVREG